MKHSNLTIVSAFRDSNVDAFVARCYVLDYPPTKLRFICVEGDSVDDTYHKLQTTARHDKRFTVIKKDLGNEKYGSVINQERLKLLATIFNTGLDAVDVAWSDFVMFIPSDVIFTPELALSLTQLDKDVIAPWFWTYNEHGVMRFYDTWAFCYQGEYFEQAPKSWFEQRFPGLPMLRMDTVGGVIMMKTAVLQAGCRYTEEEVDRGLCKMAIERGFEIWATFDPYVLHP